MRYFFLFFLSIKSYCQFFFNGIFDIKKIIIGKNVYKVIIISRQYNLLKCILYSVNAFNKLLDFAINKKIVLISSIGFLESYCDTYNKSFGLIAVEGVIIIKNLDTKIYGLAFNYKGVVTQSGLAIIDIKEYKVKYKEQFRIANFLFYEILGIGNKRKDFLNWAVKNRAIFFQIPIYYLNEPTSKVIGINNLLLYNNPINRIFIIAKNNNIVHQITIYNENNISVENIYLYFKGYLQNLVYSLLNIFNLPIGNSNSFNMNCGNILKVFKRLILHNYYPLKNYSNKFSKSPLIYYY